MWATMRALAQTPHLIPKNCMPVLISCQGAGGSVAIQNVSVEEITRIWQDALRWGLIKKAPVGYSSVKINPLRILTQIPSLRA